jgi:hypothetical protein
MCRGLIIDKCSCFYPTIIIYLFTVLYCNAPSRVLDNPAWVQGNNGERCRGQRPAM